MPRIFGLDIGTTSIGYAVVDHEPESATGSILRLGVRVFPEARDPDGAPLNQTRRRKRMMRRQLRRRRQRRRALNALLTEAGLLPRYGTEEWDEVMAEDPYELRKRGAAESLAPYQLGRALYHLAKRRHFKGRELENETEGEAPDEKEAKMNREATRQALETAGTTLGAWLSAQEKKRGHHAHRRDVDAEFEAIWKRQGIDDAELETAVRDAIFSQRPVFWRRNTFGVCRFMPDEPLLCPRGSWLSQQRRMLEMLNNVALAGGNARPLDSEERAAILARLQLQASMTWDSARAALKPLYKTRGEPGAEKGLRFNLEVGGEKKLIGNAVEAKLADVFGDDWANHPHKQAVRDAVPKILWSADYGEIGDQRVVILSAAERKKRRDDAAERFVKDFGVTSEQSERLRALTLPTGWEPYAAATLAAFLPHLEKGIRFGTLVAGPDWEEWRDETFPDRDKPTGEVFDRLPSPADKEESRRIAVVRNPTVVRTHNELRKVVNNLIDLFGKPDLIRVELARDVGKSKRERGQICSTSYRPSRNSVSKPIWSPV